MVNKDTVSRVTVSKVTVNKDMANKASDSRALVNKDMANKASDSRALVNKVTEIMCRNVHRTIWFSAFWQYCFAVGRWQ